MKSGFNLVEIILVIAIILIMATSGLFFSANWLLSNNLDATYSVLLSSLRKAQRYSIDDKNNLTWGVCLTGGTTIRMYATSCASPVMKDDYVLPSSVGLNGLADISFSTIRGEVGSSQTITITAGAKTKIIQINKLGGFQTN